MNEDSILYGSYLKQQILKWRSIAMFFALIAALVVFGKLVANPIEKDYVARVKIEGFIGEDHYRDTIISNLASNDKVKAAIIHINSPGGTIVGGESLYNTIKAVAEEKPVVAVLGTVAASGGYMAAVGTDYIVSHNGTITGSIGVLFQTADVTELTKRLGVNFVSYRSGLYKASPSPFEKTPAKVSKVVKESIMDSYDYFVDIVDEGRPTLNREEVVKLADGRIYTGRQALSVKLVDEIGNEHHAKEWLKKELDLDEVNVKTINTKKRKTPLEQFAGAILPGFSAIKDEYEMRSQVGILAQWNGHSDG